METLVGEITAILPAYNEEVSIGSIVLRTRKFADRVIVVDDGSLDRTAEVAALAGAQVLRHEMNLGKGAALKTGFSLLNGDAVIVTIDTDGQHDPADIPRLVRPILKGEADMVNGSRYLNGNKRDTPIYRRMGQKVLDVATNIGCGLSVTDTQSGFRAFAGRTKGIFRFEQKGLAIESEMLADAASAGLRIKEVEIGVRYDVNCSSENPVVHGLRVLINVLQDMQLRKPLICFTIPGLAMAAAGILMGLEFLQAFAHGGSLQYGLALIMILLVLLGSFLALTGMVLHILSRVMHEFKRELMAQGRQNKEAD
ncbi:MULTISPECIES: glycosyltransferase family 2 protein [Methanothrix]|uniref:glycosyltransferase family 2 protein n=1 Tax=Methanothrix TaxID=2222 RepID=UPI001E39AEBF|nr:MULTISPECIES: glycosyltransferase family 2 protein [Methanothrix]HRW31255.1 glycosyltransferase family 2 protein [Methanothrix sp.]